MRLASFSTEAGPSWGIVDGETIADLGSVLRGRYPDLKAVLAADALAEARDAARTAPRRPLDAIAWLPVIPNPDKILCIGLNYEMHRQETGRDEAAYPTVFTRFANTQIGHGADLVRPRVSTDLDFEGELAVVIGRPGRAITEADSWNHIAGYALYNDASVRDFQRHTHQFTPGKNFPGTGAFGPWLMTPDELGPLPGLHLRTRVNGETVQDAQLSQMIFAIPRLIAYCSSFTPLEPGDVIATGTPGGVGARRTPPLWLKPGDRVEVELDRLGVLRNGVADEA